MVQHLAVGLMLHRQLQLKQEFLEPLVEQFGGVVSVHHGIQHILLDMLFSVHQVDK